MRVAVENYSIETSDISSLCKKLSQNKKMSDSEDNASTNLPVFKPSFVLIAIDTSPLMFVKKENDGTTPFRTCLDVCYNLANSLMFTQNKRSWSPFGIVLANEDTSASFVNFDDNVLKSIKFLKEKKNLSDDDLEATYQRKGSVDLSSFLLFCKKKFKEVNSAFYKRIIIYITNDDNPTGSDKNQRFAVLNEAKNFEANGITFEMVTMNLDFDYKLFYNELFSVIKTPLIETLVEDEEGLEDKLASLILTRFYQRKVNFFPFIGDQSRFLKTREKSFIREEKIYNNAHVTQSGKTLKKISKNVAEAVKTYVLKGCDEAPLEFDMEEYFEILNTSLPTGYTLLFVSDRLTEIGSIITDNVVLETDPKEDLPYFTSFWKYCADKNKVLVCAKKLRKNGQLRFVEFIPKFANNAKVFMIKGIPFNDENKYPATNLETEDDPEYSEEKLKVTNALINNLSFDYDPKMFINPANAKKKAFLKSKLLDEPKEDVEDVTLNNEGIDENLGEIVDSFRQIFNLDVEETGKKRRKPAGTGRASAAKKKK